MVIKCEVGILGWFEEEVEAPSADYFSWVPASVPSGLRRNDGWGGAGWEWCLWFRGYFIVLGWCEPHHPQSRMMGLSFNNARG